jgi:hypothetical protein
MSGSVAHSQPVPKTLMEVLGAPEELTLARTKASTVASIAQQAKTMQRLFKLTSAAEDRGGGEPDMMKLMLQSVAALVKQSMEEAAGKA